MTRKPERTTIRRPDHSDVSAIVEFIKASWARTYDPVIGVEARKAKSDPKHVPALFLSEIEEEEGACILAEANGRVIGYVGGQLRPTADCNGTFFVDHLHVEPQYQCSGIATELMQALVEEISGFAERIELTVLENNARAIGFYEKQGFVRATGENGDDGLGGFPSVLMRWDFMK